MSIKPKVFFQKNTYFHLLSFLFLENDKSTILGCSREPISLGNMNLTGDKPWDLTYLEVYSPFDYPTQGSQSIDS